MIFLFYWLLKIPAKLEENNIYHVPVHTYIRRLNRCCASVASAGHRGDGPRDRGAFESSTLSGKDRCTEHPGC